MKEYLITVNDLGQATDCSDAVYGTVETKNQIIVRAGRRKTAMKKAVFIYAQRNNMTPVCETCNKGKVMVVTATIQEWRCIQCYVPERKITKRDPTRPRPLLFDDGNIKHNHGLVSSESPNPRPDFVDDRAGFTVQPSNISEINTPFDCTSNKDVERVKLHVLEEVRRTWVGSWNNATFTKWLDTQINTTKLKAI